MLLPVPLHQQLRFLLHNKKRVGVFALIKYAISFFFSDVYLSAMIIILRPGGCFFLYLFGLIVFPIDDFVIIFHC